MVEGQPLECRLQFGASGDRLGPEIRAMAPGAQLLDDLCSPADERDDDDAAEPPQQSGHLEDLCPVVDRLAVVEIAVGDDQHLGIRLPQAVDDPLHAEIGRARGPHRADRGCGQHADHGFRRIGHHRGDAIADPDAGLPQLGLGAGDTGAQLAPAQLRLQPILAPEDDGVVIRRPAAQRVLGVVDPRRRKEAGARHPLGIDQERRLALVADDAGKVPQLRPELRRLLDRPAIKVIVAEAHPAEAPRHRIGKARKRQLRDRRRVGRPDRPLHVAYLPHDSSSALPAVRFLQG